MQVQCLVHESANSLFGAPMVERTAHKCVASVAAGSMKHGAAFLMVQILQEVLPVLLQLVNFMDMPRSTQRSRGHPHTQRDIQAPEIQKCTLLGTK